MARKVKFRRRFITADGCRSRLEPCGPEHSMTYYRVLRGKWRFRMSTDPILQGEVEMHERRYRYTGCKVGARCVTFIYEEET